MKNLQYQNEAVAQLVKMSIELLENDDDEQNLVFKAPTGSGKTIMATRVLADLHEQLLAEGRQDVAFVWIAPQKLHLQSFEKLKAAFAENRKLTPILYDDIDQSEGVIKPGEILFVNWESVNRDGALMVQERENADSFFEILDRTRLEEKRPIYLIIDEEHRNWSKNADKSLAVVKKIHPKVELRISATPKTMSFHCVEIPRKKVIDEQMIKKGIHMNEDIEVENDDPDVNMHLLHKAMDMRNKIAKEYQRLGVNINPLLLIQLPNDTSDVLSSEDKSLVDSIKQMLEVRYNVTEENGLLGTWLSKKKTIDDNISDNDNMTQVLLFKQAIALGWDCPRAAVLLIFRNLQEETFTVQTLGRILRMPEQHFYDSDLLNYGHVYTDISRDKIKIAIEDSSYISKNTLRAERRENLVNITLPSYHQERRSEDQNRLGPQFKKVLVDEFAKFLDLKLDNNMFTIEQLEGWSEEEVKKYKDETQLLGTTVEFNCKRMEEKNVNMNPNRINVKIPRNLTFQNDVGEIDLTEKNSSRFARSMSEIRRVYIAYCHKMVVSEHFEPKKSTEKLSGYLNEVMQDLFGVFETEVPKLILSNDEKHKNNSKFTAIIRHALVNYAKLRADRLKKVKERSFKETIWSVPEERYYKMDTHHVLADVKNHALLPFVEINNVSNPEQHFSAFLERNTDYIDWWYKNGDEGMTNYSIPYTNVRGEKSLFYVDYIIRMRNGQIFLFDTKSEDSDENGAAKHNALLAYMKKENEKGKKVDGGVLIGDKNNENIWRYSKFRIEDTHDTSSWSEFFPDQYTK